MRDKLTGALPPRHLALQGIEASLEDAVADQIGQLALPLRGTIEFRTPFDEAAFAVGDGRDLERGDVIPHAHGRLENRVAEGEIEVRESEQLLPYVAAVLE